MRPGLVLLPEGSAARDRPGGADILVAGSRAHSLHLDVQRGLGLASVGHHGRDVRAEREGEGFRHHGLRLLVPGIPHHQVLQRHGGGVGQLRAVLDVWRILRPQRSFHGAAATGDEGQESPGDPGRAQRAAVGQPGHQEREDVRQHRRNIRRTREVTPKRSDNLPSS